MGKFWDWFFKPAEDLIDYVKDKEEYPLHNEKEGEEINIVCPSFSRGKSLFRPQNFNQYIGQARAKDRLRRYISGTRKRNRIFPHSLICSSAGMGKTTVVRLLAKELNKNFVECVASDLENFEDIEEKIVEVDGGVLFIDEIHAMERSLCENIYHIMEDFEHQGQKIKEFTLCGATTEIGELLKNRKPFRDRFKNRIELENYTSEDLIKIAKQYNDNMFPDDIIAHDMVKVLADNCRGNPREIITLSEATIYFDFDIKEVLRNFQIIFNGYTMNDLKILDYLSENKKGVGLNSMISFLSTSKQNYECEMEPYLMQTKAIIKTPRGRTISTRGEEILNKLKKISKENKY